jgi:phosphomevalonate kinase
MKKTLIALALSTAILGGCVSTTVDDYKLTGETIQQQGYQHSKIVELEKLRMPINETFEASKEIYDTYMTKVEQSPAYHNYMTATQGKSDDEITAIRQQLTAEDKKTIADFEEANSDILKEIGELALKIVAMNKMFGGFNATAAIMQVSFTEMGHEKDVLSYTIDQLDYLSGTIGHIYQLSSIDDANRNMS